MNPTDAAEIVARPKGAELIEAQRILSGQQFKVVVGHTVMQSALEQAVTAVAPDAALDVGCECKPHGAAMTSGGMSS
ncbi:hypothetical protein WKW77_26510 [Variovorax ureilyticus]|uniref:Uncharacterized protein n=1 Tax=Variovorax ureilyticus TaxID=1836198 RepID=A0ABU8VLW5_9BURK